MTVQSLHALVTGGSRGIGAAITRQLGTEGHRVTILGRSLASGQKMASKNPERMLAVAADVTATDQISEAFVIAREHFGPVQLVINCAGMVKSAKFLDMDADLWTHTLNVNLNGTMHCIRAALPGMLEAGWGRVVNVASTSGLVGYAYVSAYCAAKHGVVGLTRALALELAKTGVTVNAVCPGYTDTEIMRESIARIVSRTERTEKQARAVFENTNPQGRLVDPVEVANAVIWLCSEGASAVTGQAISVSGGEVT